MSAFIGLSFSIALIFLLFYQHNFSKENIFTFIFAELMMFFLLYHLGKFPNVFVDEANYFYDARSLSQYGVDSHLLILPVYLPSYWGYGQSVLYAYLSIPALKLFGGTIYSFRITQVILVLICVLISCFILNKYYHNYLLPIIIAVTTSPYLITAARYAMDCNVGMWIIALAICAVFIGINTNSKLCKNISFLAFYLLCGLCAYSYNVSWLYLPFVVIGISIILYQSKQLSPRWIFTNLILLLVEALPIIIFAIRSNIPSLNKTTKFLFLTIPRLSVGRVNASFIGLNGDILKNMGYNFFNGFKKLFFGADNLSWNSLPNFGAYYLFSIILFLIGIRWVIMNRQVIETKLLLILFLSNLPTWLVVIPNYNHWMFSHMPDLIIIGIGISVLAQKMSHKIITYLYLLAVCLFASTYFNTPRYTGFEMSTIDNVKYLDHLKGKIYFQTSDANFLLNCRDFSNKSPYYFQRTKDHPFSSRYLTANDKFGKYHRLTSEKKLYPGNYLLSNNYIQQSGFTVVKTQITIGDTNYTLYKKN